MCDILPGILEEDWDAIEKKLELVKPFAKAIHVDLLDGEFASNISFLDPKPFAKYSKDFLLELHMMVKEPIDYLDAWANVGFRRFVGHVEHMSDQAAFVTKGEELGEVGLAIDANTPLSAITVPFIDLDAILVMTVKAGFSGQAFMPENLEKVKALREKTTLPIEIDGGVNDGHLRLAKKAGASRFVATSFLFKSESPEKQYRLLQETCKS